MRKRRATSHGGGGAGAAGIVLTLAFLFSLGLAFYAQEKKAALQNNNRANGEQLKDKAP